MKPWHIALSIVLIAAILAGCGGEQATPTPTTGNETQTNTALDTSYPNALDVSSQLALGTFQLEGTENAVTPEQAKALLPLWQTLQSGTLKSEAETNAVLKQIESTLTEEQLTAIATLQLTREDLGDWAREQGLNLGLSPEALVTRQAGGGGAGPGANLNDEDRAAMRATAEAGGFGPSGNLSDEERAARRATAEAGGFAFGASRAGAGPRQINFLVGPLIELLSQRAAAG